MSTPRSPSLPAERGSRATSSDGADSPSQKRSHDAMVAGQHGTHASPIQIASQPNSDVSDEDIHLSTTPTPSHAPANTRAEQSESHFQPDDDELDPEMPLDHFDWRDLEERYHDAMRERSQEEQQLSDEFQRLMNVVLRFPPRTTCRLLYSVLPNMGGYHFQS